MSTSEAHDFLTLSEAAEILRVSVSQIYSLIKSGELPALRIGHRGPWRVEKLVLEHFLLSQYDAHIRQIQWEQAPFAGSHIAEF